MSAPNILKWIVIPFMNFARHEIILPHISIEHQTTEIFTKALSRPRHQFLIAKLMLLDRLASIQWGMLAEMIVGYVLA
jgi:uncharacterized protein YqcC (DUF446 family)